jgi:hypothetical protein
MMTSGAAWRPCWWWMSLITGIFHFEANSDHDNLPV